VRPPITRISLAVIQSTQWAAVTTFVGETSVPPQNWDWVESVICITYG
jgi:hypothetical protein